MTYAEMVAGLPVPTLEQTARFADHVAENHSWYKHLPYYPPGASFVFFLNPQAGMGAREVDGIATPYCLPTGDYFQHHSRVATAEYRTRFGHWDYWVLENPRNATCAPELGIVERFTRRLGLKRQMSQQPDGPWIYGMGENGRVLLPEDAGERGRCWFTAFLRPAPNMFKLVHSTVLHRETKVFREYARKHAGDQEVALYALFAREADNRSDLDWGQAPLLTYVMGQSGIEQQRWLGDLFGIWPTRFRREYEATVVDPGSPRPGAELARNWRHARNVGYLRRPGWGAKALLVFMETAAEVQKQRMLETLHRILEWVPDRDSQPLAFRAPGA